MQDFISKMFDHLFFGESTDFMEFVENHFLEMNNCSKNIESLMGKYYNYCDNLTIYEKKDLIINFKTINNEE